MAAAKRISDEPAFVLHSYDWSESSLILEVFCRRQGRVALVAKGAKKPTSNFRPVLLPLQPLLLTYSLAGDGSADIHTLKGAEWVGGHVMPTGDALLSGMYLNELLLRLLARADPHAALFDAYAGVVRVLASEHGDALEPVLRSFELLLLREIGLLPSLDVQTMTLAPLHAGTRYALVPEGGLRTASSTDRAGLLGSQWQALQHALDDETASYTATLRACAPVATELKPQLRAVLQYHCGSPTLRTRQLMIDLQAL
ncbi:MULTISPECIES: DNA repair protein RecO [Acidovorax]|uniref:DNA repair protein RecO n=1 Tax=Acidovorax TaxID=12916 RepID=UPI0002376A06|nr:MULTISPECIES: DNA repair protein RecO [Acidovorax]KRD26993.1 DNA repair protein RecO [Acidovorax sp. Root267]